MIVEGIDDALFCEAFIRRLNLCAIEIWPIGGKTNLKRNLGLLKKLSGFAGVIALGIIRDADDNPWGAFESVCQALRECNLPVPGGPGLVSDGVPEVRVMILPDAESPGLQSLCLRSISEDPVLGCVSRYFECLDDLGISTGEIDKARVQVYLASMEKPDRRRASRHWQIAGRSTIGLSTACCSFSSASATFDARTGEPLKSLRPSRPFCFALLSSRIHPHGPA